jgi:hypothetical protein
VPAVDGGSRGARLGSTASSWWRYIERRRVTVSLELSAFAEPDTTSFWQYRNYCPVDHQSEEMVQELLDWVVLLTGPGCMIWIGLQVV